MDKAMPRRAFLTAARFIPICVLTIGILTGLAGCTPDAGGGNNGGSDNGSDNATSGPAIPFYPGLKFGTVFEPVSIVTADFDGDGATDLLVGHENSSDQSVKVLLANGDGTFQDRNFQ